MQKSTPGLKSNSVFSVILTGYINVLNHSLDGPRLKLSLKFRVNGNEVIQQMKNRYVSSWPSIFQPPLFQFPQHKNSNSYAVNSFTRCKTVTLSTHHKKWSSPYHLRIYPIRALPQIPCRFFVIIRLEIWDTVTTFLAQALGEHRHVTLRLPYQDQLLGSSTP